MPDELVTRTALKVEPSISIPQSDQQRVTCDERAALRAVGMESDENGPATLSRPPHEPEVPGILPLQALIECIAKVERAYAKESRSEILTRLRVQYYWDLKFMQLITNAPWFEAGGNYLIVKSIDRVSPSVRRQLLAQPRESGEQNPSPFILMQNGNLVDLGHLLLGLDSLVHTEMGSPYLEYGLERSVDLATFIGDLALPLVWHRQVCGGDEPEAECEGQVDSSAPPDAKAAADPDPVGEFYEISAPPQDLLGDADAFGVHSFWVARKAMPLSALLTAYYKTQRKEGAGQRWHHVCRHPASGLALANSRGFSWSAETRARFQERLRRAADIVYGGKLGAYLITGSRAVVRFVNKPRAGVWKHARAVVDKFLTETVREGLQSER